VASRDWTYSSAPARRRLDAPDARGDATLIDDLEKADVAGARDVRAAAQLARRADVEHPHFIAVFLAEEHHRADFCASSIGITAPASAHSGGSRH
jgi:hypothetical protein